MKYENVHTNIKPISDEYGLHIRIFFLPISDSTDESPDIENTIGLVTYHVNTNSITLGKYKEDGVSDLELVEYFMRIYKDDTFKDYLKSMECPIHTKPIWSKQLKRHFA